MSLSCMALKEGLRNFRAAFVGEGLLCISFHGHCADKALQESGCLWEGTWSPLAHSSCPSTTRMDLGPFSFPFPPLLSYTTGMCGKTLMAASIQGWGGLSLCKFTVENKGKTKFQSQQGLRDLPTSWVLP